MLIKFVLRAGSSFGFFFLSMKRRKKDSGEQWMIWISLVEFLGVLARDRKREEECMYTTPLDRFLLKFVL